MNTVADETELRSSLQDDRHASLAHGLIAKLSQLSARYQSSAMQIMSESERERFLNLARIHGLAAHVIDTQAPRLRARS